MHQTLSQPTLTIINRRVGKTNDRYTASAAVKLPMLDATTALAVFVLSWKDVCVVIVFTLVL